MARLPLYRYSPQSVEFKEIRWGRIKLIILGIVLGFCLITASVIINQYCGDFLRLSYLQQSALANENKILMDQLAYLNNRLEKDEKTLDKLGDQGNELRLLADLPKINEEVQKAGLGGTESRVDFSSSTKINDLLNNLHAVLDKTEGELHIQKTSYDVVEHTVENNKDRFSHLPAIKPMEGYYSLQGFGMRLHPILHIYRMHEGIDISNMTGTPVYASADGTVDFAGHQTGFGIVLEINHGYSLKTIYGHLSKILVHEGQIIRRGQLIARSGNTGLSSAPHLHYEVRLNGVAQNPIDYFFNNDDRKKSQKGSLSASD
jgi:murein DD-endopeptidase MepM/ murein hydrolase activator NlpD